MSNTEAVITLPAGQALRAMIQRIATGPEQSQDLDQDEAREAMRCILAGEADPVQAGVYLIALRMKRETPAENRGSLDAIRAVTGRAVAAVDELIDIADPYDGFARSLPVTPFLPAVLAGCGLPALSQGVRSMGPKFGLTHHRVLRAAGKRVDSSVEAAAAQLADAGWAYLDQSQSCPALHALAALRTLIVKRPLLTTLEGLASPVQARRRTHLMTGFVHRAYPPIYSMLARHAGFASCLLVRGVEGGVVPSLRQPGRAVRYDGDGVDHDVALEPGALGIEQTLRAVARPEDPGEQAGADGAVTPDAGLAAEDDAAARAAADAGLAALHGAAGAPRDSLVYAGALALWHTGRAPTLVAGARQVREVLDSGAALARFEAGASAA